MAVVVVRQTPRPDDVASLERPTWHSDAACRNRPDADWFAVGPVGRGPKPPALIRARQICNECPVRDECLDYAQAHASVVGMWGGLDEDERRNIRTGGGVERRRLGKLAYQRGYNARRVAERKALAAWRAER